MNKNEQVARALGWKRDPQRWQGTVDWWRKPDGVIAILPDYEHDIAAAILLMFVMADWQKDSPDAEAFEIPWRGGPTKVAAAIVDAFLKSQGASDV